MILPILAELLLDDWDDEIPVDITVTVKYNILERIKQAECYKLKI